MVKKSKNLKSPGKERLLDKAKNLLGKADDLLGESVDKVKKSKAFKKAEAFVEDKLDDLEKSGMKGKLEKMANTAEKKAGSALRNLQKMGKDLAKKAEGKVEDLAENLKRKPKAKSPAKAKAKTPAKPKAKTATKPKVKTAAKPRAKKVAKPAGKTRTTVKSKPGPKTKKG